MKLTHASLFSGFGGPDLAARWMGWDNAFHCEINPFCNTILNYHFPKSKSYKDVTTTDFTPWRGKIDVLTGGFPCQPFSVAGQRKGADDNRYLWPHFLRAIREIQPHWVVGENVAGILTMVQPGEEIEVGCQASLFNEDNTETVLEQEFVVETICQDLEREGYSVQPIIIPACAVGAPHRRDRVWFIARRNDNNCHNMRKNNSGPGGFPIHKSVEMENKQRGLCLSNDPIEERWKEMGYYFDAQVDFMRERGRGGRSCESIQIRQQETEFTNNITLGESSQSEKGIRSKKPERSEQMVCSNIYKHEKISSGMFRYERTGHGGEIGCGEKAIANRADSGTEDVRSRREDEILSGRASSHSNCIRPQTGVQPASDESFRRKVTYRYAAESSVNGRRALHTTPWQDFPTQPPVCRGNDGLPFDVVRLTISYPRWRAESIKGYGNAIVPEVVLELFKAIEETYN